MIELTPTAESRLNAYLRELRRVLSGSLSVDPEDVERDVRDHIDAALLGETTPIDDSALDHVLQALGSPTQWLSESSRPLRPPVVTFSAVKQSVAAYFRHLAGGPESYRLAHLSLLVFAAGWALALLAQHPGPLLVTMPVSFIFSRAALSLFTVERLSSGQKWLLYPILVVLYFLLLLIIVCAPIAVGIHAARSLPVDSRWSALAAGCTRAGAGWLGVGIVATLFPGAVRNLFYPFATWFSRRSALTLAYFGLAVLLIGGAATLVARR